MTIVLNTTPDPVSDRLVCRYANEAIASIKKIVFEALQAMVELMQFHGSAAKVVVQNHSHLEALPARAFSIFSPLLPKDFPDKSGIEGYPELVDAYQNSENLSGLGAARKKLNKGLKKGCCYGEAALVYRLLDQDPSLSLPEAVALIQYNKRLLPYLEACDYMRFAFIEHEKTDALKKLGEIVPIDEDCEFIEHISDTTGPLSDKIEDHLSDDADQLLFFSCQNRKGGHIYVLRFNETDGQYAFYDSQMGCYSFESQAALLKAFEKYVGSRTSYLKTGTDWQIEAFSLSNLDDK